MGKVLIVVIGVGLVLGFALPDDPAPAPSAAARVATDEPAQETVLERQENGHFFADVLVNGQLVNFLVDTGATSVALSVEDAERVGLDFSPDTFEVIGRGVSGPVRGQQVRLDSVSIDGKEATDVDGVVIEGGDMSLLGQAYLSRLHSVTIVGDSMTLR